MNKLHTINLTNVRNQGVYPLSEKFYGKDPLGHEICFTNCSMLYDGKPFFAICGEMHFSRVNPDQWDDSVLKLQAGGINILSTYIFWNVHEEKEGLFRFDGQRDLRSFLEICKRRSMFVIIRIGPFDHGEMRNGGMPDWLYGKPFDVRDNSDGYFSCVRRLYGAIHAQADGLYFAQGGPIVGVQIENEYMHSSAPWSQTAESTCEWINGGHDGEEHIRALKRIAREEGIVAPFYTATGWGGAMTPVDETLPLWGGYAYRPWIFYNHSGEHPATPEYIYRDNHNNAVPETYNFEPRYAPESMPFACCEMMGGMFCSYRYRFTLPFESVDAMANIKLGSGCTMLGYYMFRGGTTPLGECTPYLNEAQVPKRTYDFQAPIGEYGQLRPSWYRLRTLHELCKYSAELLATAVTVLPDNNGSLTPEDTSSLRWCVRVKDASGFVFINNFQDHIVMPSRDNEIIELRLPNETLRIDLGGMASGENAILPFNIPLGGALIKTATIQPITAFDIRGELCAFFLSPSGIRPELHFVSASIVSIEGCEDTAHGDIMVCKPKPDSSFVVRTARDCIRVFVLSRENAIRFSHFERNGESIAVLSDTGIIIDEGRVLVELKDKEVRVMSYPPNMLTAAQAYGIDASPASEGLFKGMVLRKKQPSEIRLGFNRTGTGKYAVNVPKELLTGHKTVLLRIDYIGDIGQAFIGGELIGDNFFNGGIWELRLDSYSEPLMEQPLIICIVPVKENATVNADTTMAARMQTADSEKEALNSLTVQLVDEVALKVSEAI